ncbi:class F sortase [Catelliglobosispora koreensis]|uniref:class F sortase n=1 Tax=Catelliglobosispora koreensis TaxID=129052 RepID=UPI00037A6BE5|nr:class F sortase [Catelliglobosispora koreensis]
MKLKPLAALLVVAGLFSVGIGIGRQHGFSLKSFFQADSKAPPHDFPVLDPSPPSKIRIPAIGVAAPVHGVGKDKDGTIATPSLNLRNEAGWYREGPTPGQFGPAVIVGHVDTKDKPAVFHRLKELTPGAKIEIVRRDRQVAVFEVNSVEQFNKDHVPVPRVYQDFSRPSLRLITCGGAWVGGETGYADNVIVFASLVSSHKA